MGVQWMKVGSASAEVAVKEEAAVKARHDAQGATWRFFLKEKEEAKITFVDGDLVESEVGLIFAPPRYYEHTLWIGGKGQHYVCPEKTLPDAKYQCPICQAGDFPSLVALFTIIDHRSFTGKGDKVYKDNKRLFVAKTGTMEILAKIAAKRNGLARATFDVSRMGENSPAVGNMFDFIEKNPEEELKAAFMEEVEVQGGAKEIRTVFSVVDYLKEIIFRTPDELAKLGLGNYVDSKPKSGGAPKTGMISPGGTSAIPGKTSFAKDL